MGQFNGIGGGVGSLAWTQEARSHIPSSRSWAVVLLLHGLSPGHLAGMRSGFPQLPPTPTAPPPPTQPLTTQPPSLNSTHPRAPLTVWSQVREISGMGGGIGCWTLPPASRKQPAQPTRVNPDVGRGVKHEYLMYDDNEASKHPVTSEKHHETKTS